MGVAGPPLGGRGLVVGSTVTCVQTGSVGANAAWQAAEPSTQRKAAATDAKRQRQRRAALAARPGRSKKKNRSRGVGGALLANAEGFHVVFVHGPAHFLPDLFDLAELVVAGFEFR